MKVLIVVPSYCPAFQFGGPIYSVHNLNKSLVNKGVDITVYTTNVGLNGRVPINKAIAVDGVTVYYFAYAQWLEFLGATGWQFSIPMIEALRNNINNFDMAYIVSMWNFPVAMATHYCNRYKIPYILTPKGTLYSYTLSKKSWKKFPYYHIVAKRGIENATALHWTTADERAKCQARLGLKNRSFIAPNGLDLKRFIALPNRCRLTIRYPHLRDRKIILFLGRINWEKGLDILVKAYSILQEEYVNIHLLIVGNDESDYSREIKTLLRKHGLTYLEAKGDNITGQSHAKVTFTGMLTGVRKLEAFTCSHIFVMPSYSENFGMAAIEAMACGLPVVISNKVGIYREVEKNKAGIIVDTDPESLYGGVAALLDNEVLRKKTAMNGMRLVREYYDMDKVAAQMISIYEDILQQK